MQSLQVANMPSDDNTIEKQNYYDFINSALETFNVNPHVFNKPRSILDVTDGCTDMMPLRENATFSSSNIFQVNETAAEYDEYQDNLHTPDNYKFWQSES